VPQRTPLVVVLAGPNGAGKSTVAARVLPGALSVDEFVNGDAIALGLSAYRPAEAAAAAGRVMLERLRFLADERRDFAFETTLAGRGHAVFLRGLRATGYRVRLVFLALPDPELAIARVAGRVREGGHDVPAEVVRRRFRGGLRNLLEIYASVVDGWQVYDNSDFVAARLVAAAQGGGEPTIVDHDAWRALTKQMNPDALMTTDDQHAPAERVDDTPAILTAIRESVREAVLRHKLANRPVAVWRDGRVVWVAPEDMRFSDIRRVEA